MDAAFNDDVVVISGLIFGFSLYFSLLSENLPWRRVRIRLHRQPTSPVSRDFTHNIAKKPAVGGLLELGRESLGANSIFIGAGVPQISAHCRQGGHFLEKRPGDEVRLHWATGPPVQTVAVLDEVHGDHFVQSICHVVR